MLGSYLAKRLGLVVLTLFGASIVIFALIHMIPGDLVTILLGVTASQNDVTRAAITHALHLDQPLYVQYLAWLRGVLHGDLGKSLVTGLPVVGQIGRSFPVTFQLLVMAFVLATAIGIPAGIAAATRPNRTFDLVMRVASVLFISTPAFFIGMLFILGSSFVPGIPTLSFVPFAKDPLASVGTMLLPAIALGLALSAIVLRFSRTAMLDVLAQDYVRTGRAKGLPRRRVLYRHALRNAAVPVLAILGTQFIQLIGNMIVIEQVFGLPGMGQLIVNAIYQKDYTTIQGALVVLILFSTVMNFVLDLAYAWIDPRISYA